MCSVVKLGVKKVNLNGEVRMLKTGTMPFWTHRREDKREWFEESDKLKSIDEQDFHTKRKKGCKLI